MYYTLFVPRPLPAWLSEDPDAAALFSRDRTFFYGGIQVGTVPGTENYRTEDDRYIHLSSARGSQ
jgi:hypothetical protein